MAGIEICCSTVDVGNGAGKSVGAIASVAMTILGAVGEGESLLANRAIPATVTRAMIPMIPNPITPQRRKGRGFELSDVVKFGLDTL